MLAGLAARLDGDGTTIIEVVAQLTSEQRHGLRPLPVPLPLVPAITERFQGTELDARNRRLLLAVAVGLDDALDPLLVFDGRTAADLAADPVGEHLTIHAGRVRLVDARLGIWVAATTGTAETAAVHARLSEIFRRCGDAVGAGWHRAGAALEKAPEAAPDLALLASQLARAGHPERALLLAREAEQHAIGEDREGVELVAGRSALDAGFAVEAVERLSRLFPHAAESRRLEALGDLIVAQTFVHGAVPELDPGALRPTTDALGDWRHWTRAAAIGAVLCAERGDRRGMRGWLDALREGAARTGADQELRDAVVALSWLLVGESEALGRADRRVSDGGLLRILDAAVTGDIDVALRLLAGDEGMASGTRSSFVPGYRHSPIVRACQAVVEVLLLVWRGDIGRARDRLIQSSLSLPVALPLAGLGVVLARRLDLAVLGELGPYARALTDLSSVGSDGLVDHGIRSFLSGDFDEASGAIRLWTELGSPATAIAVPGLDELAAASGQPSARTSIAPPDVALARCLRARVALVAEGRWRSEYEEVSETARSLRSPFARARVETMLGTRQAIRQEHASARVHLQYAERLFELSGATAWARAVRDRLDRLDAREGSIVPSVDPLMACRRAWSLRLTAREVEVAMRAVHGAANRDIAAALNVSVRTVEVHLGRVFAKLDVRSRVELTVLAHRFEQHL